MTELLWIGLGVLLWVGCGVVAAGWVFAYFQRGWPCLAETQYNDDRAFAFTNLLWGPVGFISVVVFGEYRQHGWLWPRRKRK